MAESFRSRLKNAWNAFSNKENEYRKKKESRSFARFFFFAFYA